MDQILFPRAYIFMNTQLQNTQLELLSQSKIKKYVTSIFYTIF